MKSKREAPYRGLPFFMLKIWILAALTAVLATTAARADYADELVELSRSKNLGSHIQWHNLMHYQTRTFGGYKSQADDRGYFFAQDGQTNPQAEVEATIRAFFKTDPALMSDGPLEERKKSKERKPQHPQCLFPARLLFLKRELGIDLAKLPQPKCERWIGFRDGMAAKSATVVFSSYYLNNPASAFGHSFLRLNKTEAGQVGPRYELLDYGFNYAAVPMPGSALMYAISGIFGLFPGVFTTVPYYYKVREYNDYESRDIWEYELNLTAEELEIMVAHVWELGNSSFNYFYFDENCSYHVLTLIDAGAPHLNLARRLGPIVIPADTIRVLMDTPGLVRSVNFRPSGRLQFMQRFKNLAPAQKAYLFEVLQTQTKPLPTAPPSFDEKQMVAVLDTAIDYVDFRHGEMLFKPESDAAKWKQQLLLARSQIPVQSQELKVDPPVREMPHLGHPSRRFTTDYGYGGRTKGYMGMAFRYALHDLLDPTPGYPGYAQMEIFNARLRYNFEPKTLRLDDFALIHVTSLSPLTQFNKSPSWRLKVGARTIRDRSCDDCLAGNALVGVGYALQPFDDYPLNLFGLIEAEVAGSPGFDRSPVRPGVGPMLALRIPVSENWFNLAHASYRHQFPTHHPHYFEWGFESRFALTKSFALNGKWLRVPRAAEASLGGLYYF